MDPNRESTLEIAAILGEAIARRCIAERELDQTESRSSGQGNSAAFKGEINDDYSSTAQTAPETA